jgi:hypothetical protein
MTGGPGSPLLGRVLVALFAIAATLAALAILAITVAMVLFPVTTYDEPPGILLRLFFAAPFAIVGVTFALVAVILWQYVLRQSDGSPPPDQSR